MNYMSEKTKNILLRISIIFAFIFCAIFVCVLEYYSETRFFRARFRKDFHIYYGVLHVFMPVFVLFYLHKLNTLKRILIASIIIPYGLTMMIWLAITIYATPRFYLDFIPWLLLVPYFVFGGWIASIEMAIICFISRRFMDGKFPKCPGPKDFYNALISIWRSDYPPYFSCGKTNSSSPQQKNDVDNINKLN